MGAVKAPTIQRSQACKRLRQLVSTLRSRSFRFIALNAEGRVVIRRQLKRRYVLSFFEKLQPCLVGIEACASSHHWSRELRALGHTVRLMPPAYVRPYVKRQKNDAADAEAICALVRSLRARASRGISQLPLSPAGSPPHSFQHSSLNRAASKSKPCGSLVNRGGIPAELVIACPVAPFESRTGESLMISVMASETAVLKHFHQIAPYGIVIDNITS